MNRETKPTGWTSPTLSGRRYQRLLGDPPSKEKRLTVWLAVVAVRFTGMWFRDRAARRGPRR